MRPTGAGNGGRAVRQVVAPRGAGSRETPGTSRAPGLHLMSIKVPCGQPCQIRMMCLEVNRVPGMENEAEIDLLTDRARVADTRGLLILGVGNTLLADEGIGVHVVSDLAGELADRDDLTFLDGGTLSFTLAAPIADSAGLIVVDTAQLHAAPGTVRLFEGA